MPKFLCWEQGGDEEIIPAATAEAAAQLYATYGDWGEDEATFWVRIHVAQDEDRDTERTFTVAIDPPEPACADGEDHDWQSPQSVVGGIEDNPGVYSHGGGVMYTEVCSYCGTYRVTDTWAQDRETGEQGLKSVEYREADAVSLEWAHDKE